MKTEEEVLAFLDMLDLDEEMVDYRLKNIMEKTTHTSQHLTNALQLVTYKLLINDKEDTSCDNSKEIDFLVKLLKTLDTNNVDIICKLVGVILVLNPCSLISNMEHLVVQILQNLDLQVEPHSPDDYPISEYDKTKTLLYLKVCDSILDVAKEINQTLNMDFLAVPLENIISSNDELLKVHFLTSTVPKIFDIFDKYNIMGRIWLYLTELDSSHLENALKVLSALSDYYLPVIVKGHLKYDSEIIYDYVFWNMLVQGMKMTDPLLRKISLYLLKRAIDYVAYYCNDIVVNHKGYKIFEWDHKNTDTIKPVWDNFFILMESLEEKQSNIVLPALQLFEAVEELGYWWLDPAFILGLTHDNAQVRLKCIEYRVKMKINNNEEAILLLEALNDINFYETSQDSDDLKQRISKMLNDEHTLIYIIKAIPSAHLSPVPFYHITDIIANTDLVIQLKISDFNLAQTVIDILKTPCNIIAMRKAIYINMAIFVGKSLKNLKWRDCASIFSILKPELSTLQNIKPPLLKIIRELTLTEDDKIGCLKYITESPSNVEFGIYFLDFHQEDTVAFVDIVRNKANAVNEAVDRQYGNKMESFNDVLYLLKLLNYNHEKNNKALEICKTIIKTDYKVIHQCIYGLLTSETILTLDDIKALFEDFYYYESENDEPIRKMLIEIYKCAVMVLKDNYADLDKIIFSIFIVNKLTKSPDFLKFYRHELLELQILLKLASKFRMRDFNNSQSIGRSRNVFYEKHCETVYSYITDGYDISNLATDLIIYFETITDSGGYGCLKWILRISHKFLRLLLNDDKSKLYITKFFDKMWKEIEELKSNNQYSPCMAEFLKLLTQETLISKPEYNKMVVMYCNRIVEYGPIRNGPLYSLVMELKSMKNIEQYEQIITVLSEILLYCPVPRKDQRIANNLVLEIMQNVKYAINNDNLDLHFNYEIQYITVTILSTINDTRTLEQISSTIIQRVFDMFRGKVRYHGNSQLHRVLQTTLQHLVFILGMNPKAHTEDITNWIVDQLGKLPHQMSVKLFLEWYISLYFYIHGSNLNEKLQVFKEKNVPLPSQLSILSLLIKRKIVNGVCNKDDYEVAMDYILSHTMGQNFNTRLYAQYLASKIYGLEKISTKYEYIIEVINKALDENATDKNFIKLKGDYFVNNFDIVNNFTGYFLYFVLPRLCDVGFNENVDMSFMKKMMNQLNGNVEKYADEAFKTEWIKNRIVGHDYRIVDREKPEVNVEEAVVSTGTIQKKYVPWKNMSDINVYSEQKKEPSPTSLILVASLIDKLPNLGGMARTCEVFGVKGYVVNSLRHLHDKQFLGLSVSAERWIDVEEVRPGQPLKEYMSQKKAEGYTLVAAEQTSSSIKLQHFQFPVKTLLLLGHEKDGIPGNILPLMDYCVEIPQQGYVRSLNVHVTAAIFVWEYVRQILL